MMKKVYVLTCLITSLSSLSISDLSFAHGGRTDSSGCHNDRKNGGYHCHGGGSSSGISPSPVSPTPPPTAPKTGNRYTLSSLNNLKACNISVKKDDSGTLVQYIQDKLQKKGYSIAVDGDFGDNTENAVKQFQRRNNIKVDGIVGCNTYRMLETP